MKDEYKAQLFVSSKVARNIKPYQFSILNLTTQLRTYCSNLGTLQNMIDRLHTVEAKEDAPLVNEIPQQGSHSEEEITTSDHVRIVVRCRPLNCAKEESASSIIHVDSIHNKIDIKAPASPVKSYRFNCVADETKDQFFIFQQAGKQIVECALAGFNGAIVAYGQTGSGKTFTMQGTSLASPRKEESKIKGIVQMVCETIFKNIHENEKSGNQDKIIVKASYLEIYNDTLIDLLAEENSLPQSVRTSSTGLFPSGGQRLTIREDTTGSISVIGLTQFDVKDPGRCYELLCIGADKRRVATTNMNLESSRSHAVFTLALCRQSASSGVVRASRLHLVDLAGSERQRSTGASGVRLREAGGINRSLSALGNVINALSSRDVGLAMSRKTMTSSRLPSCRDSKLTFLLKDALGGNAKLCVIATISPALSSLDETLSTLEFAHRCSALRNQAVVNEMLSTDVAELQTEVRRLQASLKNAHINLSKSKSENTELLRKINVLSNSNAKQTQIQGSVANKVFCSSKGAQTGPVGSGNICNMKVNLLKNSVNPIQKDGIYKDSRKDGEDKIEKAIQNEKNMKEKKYVGRDNAVKVDVKLMQQKWLEMIETNQALWRELMSRELEIAKLKQEGPRLSSNEENKQLREEIQTLKARLQQNPELTMLKHLLEAYKFGAIEMNKQPSCPSVLENVVVDAEYDNNPSQLKGKEQKEAEDIFISEREPQNCDSKTQPNESYKTVDEKQGESNDVIKPESINRNISSSSTAQSNENDEPKPLKSSRSILRICSGDSRKSPCDSIRMQKSVSFKNEARGSMTSSQGLHKGSKTERDESSARKLAQKVEQGATQNVLKGDTTDNPDWLKRAVTKRIDQSRRAITPKGTADNAGNSMIRDENPKAKVRPSNSEFIMKDKPKSPSGLNGRNIIRSSNTGTSKSKENTKSETARTTAGAVTTPTYKQREKIGDFRTSGSRSSSSSFASDDSWIQRRVQRQAALAATSGERVDRARSKEVPKRKAEHSSESLVMKMANRFQS